MITARIAAVSVLLFVPLSAPAVAADRTCTLTVQLWVVDSEGSQKHLRTRVAVDVESVDGKQVVYATTDDRGVVDLELSAGSYRIKRAPSPRMPYWGEREFVIEPDMRSLQVDLELQETHATAIEVQVIEEASGKPVPGVRLGLTPHGLRHPTRAVTNDQGKGLIEHLWVHVDIDGNRNTYIVNLANNLRAGNYCDFINMGLEAKENTFSVLIPQEHYDGIPVAGDVTNNVKYTINVWFFDNVEHATSSPYQGQGRPVFGGQSVIVHSLGGDPTPVPLLDAAHYVDTWQQDGVEQAVHVGPARSRLYVGLHGPYSGFTSDGKMIGWDEFDIAHERDNLDCAITLRFFDSNNTSHSGKRYQRETFKIGQYGVKRAAYCGIGYGGRIEPSYSEDRAIVDEDRKAGTLFANGLEWAGMQATLATTRMDLMSVNPPALISSLVGTAVVILYPPAGLVQSAVAYGTLMYGWTSSFKFSTALSTAQAMTVVGMEYCRDGKWKPCGDQEPEQAYRRVMKPGNPTDGTYTWYSSELVINHNGGAIVGDVFHAFIVTSAWAQARSKSPPPFGGGSVEVEFGVQFNVNADAEITFSSEMPQ